MYIPTRRLRGIPPSFTATFASTAMTGAGGTEAATAVAAGTETTLITRASIIGRENSNGSAGCGANGLAVTNGRLLRKCKSSSEEEDAELGVGLLGDSGGAGRKN